MKKHHDVHGGTRKNASHRRKELALALCVSLWMAGGSVAGAANIYIDETATIQGGAYGATGAVVNSALDTTTTPATKTLSITGGDWSGWIIYGGYSTTAVNLDGYRLELSGIQNKKTTIYGASTLGSATNNYVIADNFTANAQIYGGSSTGDGGNATGNHVTLTNVTLTGNVSNLNIVVGGYSQYGGTQATGNTVTLTNSTVCAVFGGKTNSGAATNNIVTLKGGTTINGNLIGGDTSGDAVTGNTLNLSGASNIVNVGSGGSDTFKGGKVKNFETINITGATWGTPVLTLTGAGIVSNGDGTKTKIDASTLTFAKPETVADGATMNLIKCENAATITADLAATTTTALQEYAFTPVTGVTIDAAVQGSLALTNTALTCTASNKATKLTFTDVEWKESGALINHATDATKNIDFNGAAVDTTNIHFTNIQSLEANKKMTLVSSFGNTVGAITGDKYTVGTTLEGKGKASLSGSDLIFTTDPDSEGGGGEGGGGGQGGGGESGGSQGGGGLVAQEQTHNTVMGATVSIAALSAGNDFVGAATEGLSLASNVGADGVSSFAQMGGGSMRQETGSHVDTHTWNAILALGHQNKKERGTFEYGAFFEYGSGNYTTHNGDERGDGSMHYTGGGLLAKYTRANGVYVEGSLRAGSVHDDARNVLRDVQTRVPYSYETNAPYMGFHLGVGKEIALTNGNTVDVYGKYFYNRKNSVSFDAGGHYDLDAVTSQVIRVGARYNIKRDKWNFYAGAAYEHELDGKATGTADGVAIRGADTGGASFRGEIGATMKPGENSPWSLDLNVSGFAGKKQGFTGGVSVAFMF